MRKIQVTAVVSLILFVSACASRAGSGEEFTLAPGSLVTPGDLLIQADSLLRDARYDEAVSTITTAINEFAENDRVYPVLRARLLAFQVDRQLGNYEKARDRLELEWNASRSFLSGHDSLRAAYLSERGRVFVRLADYERADSLLSRAVGLIHSLSDEPLSLLGMTYQALGLMYHFQGKYDRALDFYEKSTTVLGKAHGSFSYEATIPLNNIANITMRRGDYPRALRLHEKILQIRKSVLRHDHPAIAATYGNMGIVFINVGDYEHALSLHRRAKSIWEENYGSIHPELAATISNIGEAQSKIGNYVEALTDIERAVNLNQEILGSAHPRTAFAFGSLGETLALSGDNKGADKALSHALNIWEKQSTRNIPFYWTTLRDLALVRLKKGQRRSAERLLEKALNLSTAAHHPLAASIANDLVEFFMTDASPDEKLKAIQNAIRLNSASVISNDPLINPSIRGALSDPELLRSLTLKANTLLAAGRLNPPGILEYSLALETLDRGSELIDKMRLDLISQGSKVSLVQKASELYSKAVTTALSLFQTTGERRYLRSAFHYGEARKSRLLLDAMADSDARTFAGISDSLLEHERSLRVNISYLERRLAEMQMASVPDSSRYIATRNDLFDSKQAYESLIHIFEVSYPDYYALKHNEKTASIPDLRSHVLDEDTALLEYVLEPDSLYIFTLTMDSLSRTVVGLDEQMSDTVDSLRWGILHRYAPTYSKYAHKLYRYLIEPVNSLIGNKDLIVVPEGVLNLVPFEVLLTHPVSRRKFDAPYKSYPYLIRSRAITYSYSATLLNETATRKSATPTREFIGFAPGFGDEITLSSGIKRFLYLNGTDTTRKDILDPLPGTQDEIEGINYVLNKEKSFLTRAFNSGTKLLMGWKAGESALFRYPVEDYRYVHFATHSFANSSDPRLSGMLLPSRSPSENGDGILHTGEVYGLRLNADMVVLSACDTGIGSSAEGLIGFSRGFLYAGAKNLVVSLWPSDDASTKILMLRFYRNLANGESIRDALRFAKLDLIRHGGQVAKPFYWSPFIEIGGS